MVQGPSEKQKELQAYLASKYTSGAEAGAAHGWLRVKRSRGERVCGAGPEAKKKRKKKAQPQGAIVIHDLDATRLPDQTQLGRPKARGSRQAQVEEDEDEAEATGEGAHPGADVCVPQQPASSTRGWLGSQMRRSWPTPGRPRS